EIDFTNLILFAEISKADALSEVSRLGMRYVALVCALIGVGILILYFVLIPFRRGLANIIGGAIRIARGEFSFAILKTPFYDMRVLSEAFAEMCKGLQIRDEKIRILFADRMDKMRLESSMEISRNLQESFLP